MTPRAQEIRRDLESLRQKEFLAGPDYILDWIAEEVERDEAGNFWQWPDLKKPRKKKAVTG